MRFLLDMGIPASVGIWLRQLGHNAVHLNDEQLFMLPDHLILEKAIAEKRIILTSDMDFGHLLSINKHNVASVIQFRTSDFTSANIKNKLQILFDQFADHLQGQFIITVEDNRTRLRTLPL